MVSGLLSKSSIESRRRMAEALLAEAGSGRPAYGGWGEGIARALTGVGGGLMMRNANNADSENRSKIAEALQGGATPDDLETMALGSGYDELYDIAGGRRQQQYRQEDMDYRKNRDTTEDQFRQQGFDYGVNRDESQDAWKEKTFDYGVQHDQDLLALEREKMGVAGQPDFKDVSSIRKEIGDLPSFKSFSSVIPVYNSMVKASDNKAGDLNLVYGLAKIYDPTSVVREGEQVLVRDTASLPDWLIGNIQSVNGGARLLPATRKAILGEAKTRSESYKDAYEAQLPQYRDMAKRYGMNEADIIPQMGGFEEGPMDLKKKYGLE
jgi:hypothetical protein